ncbi:MAG: hypothetical protein WCP55_08090 [Lentisphaerota bacterium]
MRNIDVCLCCDAFKTDHTDGYLKEDIDERQRQVVKDYWSEAYGGCMYDTNDRSDFMKPLKNFVRMNPNFRCQYKLEHLVVPAVKGRK